MRKSRRLRNAILYSLVLAWVALAALVPAPDRSLFAAGERMAFDVEMKLLRDLFPLPVDDDIVLIGTDAESEKVFHEPIALWHKYLGQTYLALAQAQPRAVGVDFGLPERSFDSLLKQSVDAPMMRGLIALRCRTVLVIVQHVSDQSRLVEIQPNFQRVFARNCDADRADQDVDPQESFGPDRHVKDPDGVSRRFSDATVVTESGAVLPTLVGRMLRRLGRPVRDGYIDYSIGERVHYIPMQNVIAWLEAGDIGRLKRTFGGRIVLIGSMGGDKDRWRFPVKTIELLEDAYAPSDAWHPEQPGVMIHLQVLRSHLAGGMIAELPPWIRWLLCALASLAVLVRARTWMIFAGAAAFPVLVLAMSTFAIRYSQVLLPAASMVMCFWIALTVRAAFDALAAILERIRIHRIFAGQVSPGVMREMISGGLSPDKGAELAEICVLFSDVRDFTTLSEKMPPEVVTAVLQRYFDRMVRAVHKHNGTVDKFIGDGLMVLFGAPRKLDDACGDAVQCSLEMMAELDRLNEEFQREGLPTLTIGIGVNYGTVTVGNIGSSERHNYSAIGDAVNVAARLEGLTKELGRKILITEAVVSRIGERFHFDSLGEHKVKGHSPVKVWGIRTARAAPAAA